MIGDRRLQRESMPATKDATPTQGLGAKQSADEKATLLGSGRCNTCHVQRHDNDLPDEATEHQRSTANPVCRCPHEGARDQATKAVGGEDCADQCEWHLCTQPDCWQDRKRDPARDSR